MMTNYEYARVEDHLHWCVNNEQLFLFDDLDDGATSMLTAQSASASAVTHVTSKTPVAAQPTI